MAELNTLISDIEKLFEGGHDCDAANVEALGHAIAKTVAARLKEAGEARKFTLRLSQLGRPDRQLWYDAHHKGEPEKLTASTKMKFLFGDILEDLLLFLATEAGHEVTDQQKELVVDGVKGHMDCKIDGVPVDTKSASTRAFEKFRDGTLRHQDDFGYMWQIAAYCHAEGAPKGAFFAIDKQMGHMCVLEVPKEELGYYNVRERVAEQKATIALNKPPERCYDDDLDGKSGNRKLGTACSYCKHKIECWPELRVFLYSNGPRFLTKVVRQPDVPEAGVNKDMSKNAE